MNQLLYIYYIYVQIAMFSNCGNLATELTFEF